MALPRTKDTYGLIACEHFPRLLLMYMYLHVSIDVGVIHAHIIYGSSDSGGIKYRDK